MRVTRLTIRGFRAFGTEVELDLDADAVLVLGANGQGKTSLFDALLWLLTGEVPRLRDPAAVVSKFSPDGEATVKGQFRSDDGELIRVVRTTDGTKSRLLLERSDESFRGDEAEAMLLRVFWPEALFAPDSKGAFTSALRRGVYLEQDKVREFIDSDDDQERFNAVSELVGAGRVAELQRELERTRKAWNTVTNRLDAERQELRERLDIGLQRLDGLSSDGASSEAEPRWEAWWTRGSGLGVVETEPPSVGATSTPRELDRALGQLNARRLSLQRQQLNLAEMLTMTEHLEEPDPSALKEAKAVVEAKRQEIADLESSIAQIQTSRADRRQEHLAIEDVQKELGLLAELALRHLEERCPICQQEYDYDKTVEHLSGLVQTTAALGEVMPDLDSEDERIRELTLELNEKQQQLANGERQLSRLEAVNAAWNESSDRLRERLAELDIQVDAELEQAVPLLTEREAEIKAQLSEVRELIAQGEELALDLARIAEIARRSETESEISQLRREVSRLEAELAQRRSLSDLATQIIEELREAGSDVVEEELKRIQPILQRLYSRIDPHIAFRAVRFLTEYPRGRGRLRTGVVDTTEDVSADVPATVLSSSQMNALAVCVFLSFNLGLPTLPLETAVLDDPLQSLDDVNLLGLIDMLRRTRERRQLMLSTHDPRFAGLLERKLRPITDNQRTILIEFKGWSREGPQLATREVPLDSDKLRIVA